MAQCFAIAAFTEIADCRLELFSMSESRRSLISCIEPCLNLALCRPLHDPIPYEHVAELIGENLELDQALGYAWRSREPFAAWLS
jgi:hypothetical protein